MTPQQALEVLKQHQEWKNKEDFYLKPYTYEQLQEALNIAIEVMEDKSRKFTGQEVYGIWEFADAQLKIIKAKKDQSDNHAESSCLSFASNCIVDIMDTIADMLEPANSLNLDKPDEVEAPYVIPNHTIPIERIEEIIISTAPAPAKLNQIANLIEKYKK